MVKMKGLSRGYVRWPILDKDIERTILNCEGCRETANNPAHTPLHQWEYPTLLWQRLYIDFTGPGRRKMLVVMIEAHSKWPEIFVMLDTTAEETVSTLCSLFAQLGLPKHMASDSRPQFTSTANGVRHVMGAPYQPCNQWTCGKIDAEFQERSNSRPDQKNSATQA